MNGLRQRILVFLIPLVFASGPALASQEIDPGQGVAPRVVASIPALALIANEIVGEPEVRALLPAGGNPHSFELTPSEVKSVQDASVLLVVGLGFDDWARRIPNYETHRDKRVRIVVASEGLALLPLTEHGEHAHHESWDPHFWMDPSKAVRVAVRLAEVLSEIDPEQAVLYRNRAAGFAERTRDLDQELLQKAAPLQGVGFVATHAGWAYFAEHFGMLQGAVLQVSPNREPGPRALIRIIEEIKAKNHRAVFTDARLSEASARVVAEEADIPIVRLDLQGAAADAKTYGALLRWNLEAILHALADGA